MAKCKTTPWNKIKAEYLQDVTPKELAKKYGLTSQQVRSKATKEKWTSEKLTISNKVTQNAQDKVQKYVDTIIDNLYNIVIDKNEKTCDRINAGKVIIDLSGLKNDKPKEKTELPTINIYGVKI